MEFTLKPDGSMAPKEPGAPADGPGAAPAAPAPAAPGLVMDSAVPPTAVAGDVVKESDTANFTRDVIEPSMNTPVIVDFWAPWCGPCKQLGPMLEKLVKATGGLVRMVKINVDENQDLAGQLRIQSIPAVFAFDKGQPVDGFMGALPESQLKQFIDKLLGDAKPPLEAALEEAQTLLDAGDHENAAALFRQIQQQDPTNADAIAGILRAALAADDTDTAKEIVDSLPVDLKTKAPIQAAISALELSEGTVDSGEIAGLEAKLAAEENDHQARFDLAVALSAAGRNEEAIDQLLELIRRDRAWNEEAGRMQLLKIFEALGPSDPLVSAGRRQLSSVLFS